MDAAECIGCGACVAACPNASAMLYTAAKVSHLGLLPQGQPERYQRVLSMMARAEQEGFGSCTNIGECEAACPKEISLDFIGRMNRDFIKASFVKGSKASRKSGLGWLKALSSSADQGVEASSCIEAEHFGVDP